MRPRPFVIELVRYASDPAFKWAAVVPLALATVFGSFAWATGGFLGSYLELTYLVLPAFMLPVATTYASRERATQAAVMRGVTPLRAIQVLGAQFVFLVAYVLVSIGLTVPGSILFAAPSVSDTGNLVLPYALWGALIGTIASVAGLVIGYGLPHHKRMGLALAILVVFAWWGLAAQREALLALVSGTVLHRPIFVVLYASPLTWAFAGLVPGAILIEGPAVRELVGVLLAWTLVSVGLCILVTRLQGPRGWMARSGRTRHGILAAMLIVGALSALAVADGPEAPPPTTTGASKDGVNAAGNVSMKARAADGTRLFVAARDQAATLEVTIVGEAGEPLTVDVTGVTSPTLAIQSNWNAARTLELEAHGPDTNEGSGIARFEVPIVFSVGEAVQIHEVRVDMVLDGAPALVTTDVVIRGWAVTPLYLVISNVSIAAPVLATAQYGHRRMSAWRM